MDQALYVTEREEYLSETKQLKFKGHPLCIPLFTLCLPNLPYTDLKHRVQNIWFCHRQKSHTGSTFF